MRPIIAFIGKSGATMAGDMREITFEGDKPDRKKLEKELYSGALLTDDELVKKAEKLWVKISILFRVFKFIAIYCCVRLKR